MEDIFLRVKNILDRLKDVLRCQKCFQLKEQNEMLFYRSCDHFFCSKCLGIEESCPLCENELEKPVDIINDKNMLSLYQSLIKLELPSKNNIKLIYKSCMQSKQNLCRSKEESSRRQSSKTAINISDGTNGKNSNGINETQKNSFNLDKSIKNARRSSSKEEKQKNEVVNEAEVNCSISPTFVQKYKKNKSTKRKSNKSLVGPVENKVLNLNDNSLLEEKQGSDHINEPRDAKSKKLTLKLDINKKNAKGETLLHIACRKSNYNKVKELIEAGADPNEPDNAGWTSLHEAVFSGKPEIVKFLLENKAKVNLPGLDNSTALHEAVAHSKTEIVKLLLEYDGNINAINVFRETPLELAKKYGLTEIKEILMAWIPKESEAPSERVTEPLTDAVIFKHNLSIDDEKLMNKFVDKFDLEFVSSLTGRKSPTHIVVSSDRFDITWGVVLSVLNGCWLVSVDWAKNCIESESLKSASSYQLETDKFSGFIRSRVNKSSMFPGLFCGCHFFFGGGVKSYEVKSITVSTDELQRIIEKNGGKIIKRSPDPESLSLEKTVPYHADPSGSLKETAYYIIYQNKRWVPPLIYKMPHVKGLPIEWLLASMFRFELIDPNICEHPESFL